MTGQVPNGEQVFLDDNGDPLDSGQVYMYVPATTTPKDTWQNVGRTVLNTNPVLLDSSGRAVIWGDGQYRQVLKDSLGNTIWDEVVAATSGGVADAVDTIAALKALDVTNLSAGQLIFARGYYAAYDTGGGLFTVVTSSPGADNGGTIIHSDTSGYYFRRFFDGFPSIDMFGADPTGANDSAAALTAASAIGGAYTASTGTYLFASSVTAVLPTRIIGAVGATNGTPTTLFRFTASDSADRLILGTGSSELYGFGLENIIFEAPNSTGGAMIFCKRIAQSTFKSCIVDVADSGIVEYGWKIWKTNTLSFYDSRVIYTTAAGWYAYGDDSDRVDVIQFTNCNVSGDSRSTGTHLPNAIELNGSVHTVVGHSFRAVDCNRGLYRHNAIGTTTVSEFDIFHDFECDFPELECLRYDYGGGGYYTNAYLHGSRTTSNVIISHNASPVVGDFSFTGGKSTGAYHHGMYLDGRFIRVVGMEIAFNGQASSGTKDGLVCGPNSVGVTATGNRIGQATGFVVETQRYGVWIENGAIEYNVTGNDLSLNVTGPLLNEGDYNSNSAAATTPNVGYGGKQSFSVQVPTTGGTFTFAANQYFEKLILIPAGTLAAYTVVLHPSPAHGQEFWLHSVEQITTLTLTAPGTQTIQNTITSIVADGSAAWKYDIVADTWYPILVNNT